MQNKSVVKNYLYNFSYQILLLIVPLITTPILSRVLGPNPIGSYGYTQSICTYFILFGTIGINMYGQREVAYVQNDKTKRSKIFFEIIILRALTVSFSLVFYVLLFCNSALYSTLFIIQAIDIIASACDISWFYQGMENFKKTVIRNFVVKIIGVFVILCFIKGPNDLPLYVFCNSLILLFGNLSLWLSLRKEVSKVPFNELQIKKHLKPTLILFLPQIATQIYTVLDKTMIGQLSTITQVGLYEQSQKIVKIGLSVVTALGTVMLPRMASVFASGDKKMMRQHLEDSFQFVTFLSIPIMFGLIGISNFFVPWFLGHKFVGAINIIIVTSPIIYFIAISNVIGMQYLLPTRRQGEFTLSVIVGSLVNFVINFILIAKYKAVGAAIGSVCAELTVTLIQCYAIREDYGLKRILSISAKRLIAGLIMALIVFKVSTVLDKNFVNLFLIISIGAFIYVAILLLFKDCWIYEKVIYKIKRSNRLKK
ncbi:MAG: flippase [Erysipelotrichaceae bacterium]